MGGDHRHDGFNNSRKTQDWMVSRENDDRTSQGKVRAMTERQVRRLFPRASEDFIRTNSNPADELTAPEAETRALGPNAALGIVKSSHDSGRAGFNENHHHNSGASPEPQCSDRARKLALARQAQKDSAERIHLRIISVRKRLLDPDNLVPKWTIDALRYCGIIRGDEPDKITLETSQRKAAKGEEEHTEVTLTTTACNEK